LFLDLLGSAAFSVVQSDLKGNIAVSSARDCTITYPLKPNVNQKVRARYDATPTLSATLESLVENEKGEKKRTATEGLLWLLRGLSFTCKALQNAQGNKAEELVGAFTKSYDVTLKKFHNFVVKGIFSVSCNISIQ
jgi:Glycolipid transfer protein (GLTP)